MAYVQSSCFRIVWEGRCAVKGCDHATRLEGEWSQYPKTPQFFHMASGSSGEIAGGWTYFHRGYLAYRADPKIAFDSILLCPEHTPAWKAYYDAMRAWDKIERAERKSWWQTVVGTLAAPFRPPPSPPKPPMPPLPFDMKEVQRV